VASVLKVWDIFERVLLSSAESLSAQTS
jgi:hypothetical protein